MENNFNLRKYLTENRVTSSTKILNEVKFTKKEIINSVTFLNGDTYTVGEYSNYDDMRVTAIVPIPENERDTDEVVSIEMKGSSDKATYEFDAQGEEIRD